MPKILLSFLILTLFCGWSSAQSLSVKGFLQDKTDKSPLSSATLRLVAKNDSTIRDNAVSDKMGSFEFNNLSADTFILSISSIGYEFKDQILVLTDSSINTGVLYLFKKAKQLENVTVIAKEPTVQQKGDTLQYNASQFKVNPDANAEDMIKKMPGITVDKGTVTAQGEQVKKVTIDGREFFGDDATAALRNLPAEIIDKIQVFDRLSDQAQFTGFDDGNSIKAINIVTKANMRNGQFGRVFAGYGTEDRYNAGGNVSFFKENRRISIVGLLNNIDQQNFSTQDLLGVTSTASGGRGGGSNVGGRAGGSRGGAGGGGAPTGGGNFGNTSNFLVGQQDGVSKTNAIGINFSDVIAKKLTVSGSYFYNNSITTNNKLSNTQYLLGGDSVQLYKEDNISSTNNTNNRISMRVEYKIDSANTILITPSLNFQNNKITGFVNGLNFFLPADTISKTLNNSSRNTNGYNISNNILFRHAFAKKGRTISLNLTTGWNKKDGESYLNAINQYYKTGTNLNDSLQQFTDIANNGHNVSANIAYTEPISKKGQIQINYSPSFTKSNADQETYNYDFGVKKYSLFDTTLSNKFNNTVTTQSTGLSFRHGDRDNMYSLGLSYQNALYKSDQVFPLVGNVTRSYNNILPNAMLRLKLSGKSSIRLFYRASTTAPSTSQLQNVIDITNPLFPSTGNPDLKQQYGHTLSTRYTYTNSAKGQTFFANIFLLQQKDYISNSTFIPSKDSIINNSFLINRGAQLSKPVNLNGYWSIRSFFTFGLPLKFIKSNLNWNTGLLYSKTPGLINNVSNISNNYTYNIGAVLASNVSEYIDFTLSYSANFNVVKNSIQVQANNNSFNQSASVQFNLLSKKGWFFQNDLTNQLYKGLSGGYNQNYWLWNVSAGKKFLKNQAGELKVTIFDLLKQNSSITRIATGNYIQDVQNTVLQQYFMLTFSYKLKNFGTPAKRRG